MTRHRRGTTLAALALAGLALTVAPSYADTNDPPFPSDPTFPPDQGSGIPGAFVAFFVFVLLVGIAATVWKVTMAQKMAKQSGMDPSLATQMTLLSDDGLDATYLASSLRQQPPPASPTPTGSTGSTAARLEELKGLLDQGLVTQAEYDERRKAIIDSL